MFYISLYHIIPLLQRTRRGALRLLVQNGLLSHWCLVWCLATEWPSWGSCSNLCELRTWTVQAPVWFRTKVTFKAFKGQLTTHNCKVTFKANSQLRPTIAPSLATPWPWRPRVVGRAKPSARLQGCSGATMRAAAAPDPDATEHPAEPTGAERRAGAGQGASGRSTEAAGGCGGGRLAE